VTAHHALSFEATQTNLITTTPPSDPSIVRAPVIIDQKVISARTPKMSDSEIEFLPLGAIIQTFKVGGLNIVQNFPTAEQYKKYNAPYFGETIGRVANRISNAKIDSLNGGKSYTLAANNGPNSLHGGPVGWGKRVWDGPKPVGVRDIPGLEGGKLEGGESVEFTLTSQDGDEGFPGDVVAKVIYTAGTQTVNGKKATILGIEYEAELVGGAEETVMNITNHSYVTLGFTCIFGKTSLTIYVCIGTSILQVARLSRAPSCSWSPPNTCP
jgi:aldose 1-epimerase